MVYVEQKSFYRGDFINACRDHFLIMLEGEASGRLLRYDPPTGTTHVVLDGLTFANGVQLSQDQSFLLFTETTNCRLLLPSLSLCLSLTHTHILSKRDKLSRI